MNYVQQHACTHQQHDRADIRNIAPRPGGGGMTGGGMTEGASG